MEQRTEDKSAPLKSANSLQSILGDDLFATPQHVSDIKQVLEIMKGTGESLRQEQIRAILMLDEMGNNKFLHPNGNPYKDLIQQIKNDFKVSVVSPNYYLDAINELVPKPPKPVVFAPNGKMVDTSSR